MRNLFIGAALLSASLPALASAQPVCETRGGNRTVGTVAGAAGGGVLGNVIAGQGDKRLGTVIGAVAGGLLGNQVTKGGGSVDPNCARAYGWYDSNGVWQPSNVAATAQAGYFDRDGRWMEGAPRGYYDRNGRWVAANGAATVGFRDEDGRWIAPTAADFDRQNRYSAATATGYWQDGRWVAGTTSGHYDSRGRWIAGEPAGYRDANGNWVDEQPGYYDRNGRWVAGTTRGSYDSRGRFIASSPAATRAPIDTRLARIEQRIDRGIDDGSLDRNEATRAQSEIDSIRRYHQSLQGRNGTLTARNEALVQQRLDRLADELRTSRSGR